VARLFTAEVGHSSAVTNGFVADSLLGQAGFEPSVPHLIGGVRRAIGKAADKLREAPDAGTRVAESSFFEPSEPAPLAARDPGRKKLQPPGRLAFSIYQNLPRIICRDWPAASPREQRVSPLLRGRYKKGLGYATAKRKSGSARDRKGSGASRSRSAVRCRASPA
jgi:hypothetical protein